MYAVTHSNFSRGAIFPPSPSMTRKGLTLFLQSPETLEADTGNPGKWHADPVVSGSGGLQVYNAPRFNCDLLRICANLEAIRLVHSATSRACRVRFRHR